MADQQSLLGEDQPQGANRTQAARGAPLADRMRPRTLDEIVGQPELTAPGSPLRAAIDAGQPRSLILWGPPGVGKTTIARAIAEQATAAFEQLNAVTDGIKELRAVIERARHRPTLLFIDEIARWNKAQQDALLPHVESGRVTLVGATTEHPGREINNALMSRLKLFTLRALDDAALSEIAERALSNADRGLGARRYELSADAREHILLVAGGDARAVLNALEAAAVLLPEGGEITLSLAQQGTGSRRLAHNKAGEQHYDLISALIKSVRGSSVSAALYWLARLEAGGEDPAFVARRLVVSASEEIGIAAPGALAIAVAGYEAVKNLGPPECWINLAAVTAYLASCPKSWAAYDGWRAAQELVREQPSYRVPDQLRNATTQIDRAAGAGKGYVHASQPGGADVEFLPSELRGTRLFNAP